LPGLEVPLRCFDEVQDPPGRVGQTRVGPVIQIPEHPVDLPLALSQEGVMEDPGRPTALIGRQTHRITLLNGILTLFLFHDPVCGSPDIDGAASHFSGEPALIFKSAWRWSRWTSSNPSLLFWIGLLDMGGLVEVTDQL